MILAIPTSLLNKSANVYRSSGEVRDGRGGFKASPPAIISTGLLCRVNPAGAREAQVYGINGVSVSHVIYLSPESDVRRDDQLEIDNKVYLVQALELPSESIYLKLACQSVQRAGLPA